MFQVIIFIIYGDILMFQRIFLSLQNKRFAILTYQNGIYELPSELPNDLKVRILGDYEKSGKCLDFIELQSSAQSPWKNGYFVNTSKILFKNRKQIFFRTML